MSKEEPWFARPQHLPPPGAEITVVGAGMAGCAAAYALAKRGFKIRVLEAGSVIAGETSGHPSAVVFPQIAKRLDPLATFYLEGYRHSLELLGQLCTSGYDLGMGPEGVVHLAVNRRLRGLVASFDEVAFPRELCRLVDRDEASELAGVALDHAAFFYPQAVALDPRKLCRALLDEAAIEPTYDAEVVGIELSDHGWRLTDAQGEVLATCPWVILATANRTRHLPPVAWFPTTSLRGQLAYLRPADLRECPQRVICGDGYFIPQGVPAGHLIGATFDPDHQDPALDQAAHERLWRQTRSWLGSALVEHTPALDGRVAFRCVTNDHLPLIGPAPRLTSFLEVYDGLRLGRVRDPYPVAPYWPGLFVSCAHAARGTVSAPFAGELIARYLTGETMPVDEQVLRALLPARFIMRALRRNRVAELLKH